MDIGQLLRNAINNKVAKILKEEYGIETPKEIADKLSEDDQDYGDYQIRLTNVGDHKIRVVTVVFNNMDIDLKTAKALVDQAPSVISQGLTFERATEIVKLLNNAGALDNGQRKYYPYFVRDPGDAKHIIVNASVTVGCDALCLNRICFKSEKRAIQFGEQFIDLFKQVLLK